MKPRGARPPQLRPHAAARAVLPVALLLGAALALPLPARAEPEPLKRARDAFEYGDFARSVELLKGLPDSGVLAAEADRVEAWRMLGLSLFYLEKKTEASNAFFGLLKQNPDYQLDPFYVPPNAVAFFDQVRKESEPLLAPIRERRNRRIQEERAEEEARRRADLLRQQRLAELLEKQAAPPVVIERRVVESSVLGAWMPFGAGQFQNGRRTLGFVLLGGQIAAAAISMVAWLNIEYLRGADGKFRSEAYQTAKGLDVVKWVSASLFYALWAGGAIEANMHFVPERVVEAPLKQPPAANPPARTPAGSAPAEQQRPDLRPAPAPPAVVPASAPALGAPAPVQLPATDRKAAAPAPLSTQPGSTQPGSTQPGSTQPGSTQPGSTQPGSTQPGPIQPGSTGTPVSAAPPVPAAPPSAPVPPAPTSESPVSP